jgi:hypothetical protein
METKLTLHGEILGVRYFFETKCTLSHNKKNFFDLSQGCSIKIFYFCSPLNCVNNLTLTLLLSVIILTTS